MVLIVWDESFSVNVKEIDSQHMLLVSMINELSDAMGLGKGRQVMEKLISGLTDYATVHFNTEEKYFDKFDYPEAVSHKNEHGDFVQRILTFKEGFENGKLGLSVEVLYFLRDWLTNHIKGTDKEYTQFFNRKGLR